MERQLKPGSNMASFTQTRTEMTASQLLEYIQSHVLNNDGQRFVDSPKVGEFLIESFFKLGARDTWNNILKMATGEKLRQKYFVKHALEEDV